VHEVNSRLPTGKPAGGSAVLGRGQVGDAGTNNQQVVHWKQMGRGWWWLGV
jgi:hypothetical protein